MSIFLVAFLPWGILAPLNLIKMLLNTVSPMAHFWVPKETEQCQAACGVARMWGTLFWSMQLVLACSYVYVHYHRGQTGLAYLGVLRASISHQGKRRLAAQTAALALPAALLGRVCGWQLRGFGG